MFPAAIEGYFRPTTIEEAVRIMKEQGEDTHFIAGGQSIMQAIKSRLLNPRNLIDLQAVNDLAGISRQGSTTRIGAMTRYCDIATSTQINPAHLAIRDAASHVGDRQIRNRGTIGGSLNWNYVSSCIPPSCVGVGARVELLNANGDQRFLDAGEFLGWPLETEREDDEIMVAVHLDDTENTGSAYKKWGLVTDSLPVVNICCSITVDASGACSAATLVLGALSTGPGRIAQAESALTGARSTDTQSIRKALAIAATEANYESEATADSDYKAILLDDIGQQVITTAFARAQGALS